ncbi:MAG TPA: polymer-forming cytoskeletal protein [Holophagaceae bacterium]|nr:polymer-forming cytoskeletal protein [Holophagaceae bacterium]
MVFGGKKQKPQPAPAVHTILGRDMIFKGEIIAGGKSLRVEGTVDGSIQSEGEVIVAPGGLVTGQVLAKHLVVTGKVKGTVKTTECLEIHGTGFVEGEVEVGRLVVDEGGILQGTCIRRDEPKAPEVAKGGSLPGPEKVTPEVKR